MLTRLFRASKQTQFMNIGKKAFSTATIDSGANPKYESAKL